jgi:multiple sugar transport system substrate-binding protein
MFASMMAVLGGLTACGGSNETETEEVPNGEESAQVSPEELEGELEIWTFFGQVEDMAAGFEEKYPNVDVNVSVFPGDQYQTKIMTAIQTRTDVPDIFDLERGYMGKFINQNFVTDLSAMGADELVEDYVPYVRALGEGENGEIRAISDHSSPGAFWYHRDQAKEYLGTDDPEEVTEMVSNWESIIELGKQVQEDSNGEVHLFSHFGDVFNVEKSHQERWVQDGQLVIDPNWEEVINHMREVRDGGVDAKLGFFSAGWGDALNEGNVIMFAMPAWAGFMVNNEDGKAEGKYGLAMTPKGYYDGGTYRSIYEGSENKELAYEFIKYIASEEWQERNLEATGNMPGLQTVYEDNKESFTHEFFGDQQVLDVYNDVVMDIPAVRATETDEDISRMFYDTVSAGIENNRSNEEILERFTSEVRNAYPDLQVE